MLVRNTSPLKFLPPPHTSISIPIHTYRYVRPAGTESCTCLFSLQSTLEPHQVQYLRRLPRPAPKDFYQVWQSCHCCQGLSAAAESRSSSTPTVHPASNYLRFLHVVVSAPANLLCAHQATSEPPARLPICSRCLQPWHDAASGHQTCTRCRETQIVTGPPAASPAGSPVNDAAPRAPRAPRNSPPPPNPEVLQPGQPNAPPVAPPVTLASYIKCLLHPC